MSEDIAADELARRGIIYSFSVVHVGGKGWPKPFTVGYVDLECGVRVFAHLRGAIQIGTRVELSSEVATQDELTQFNGTLIDNLVFKTVEA